MILEGLVASNLESFPYSSLPKHWMSRSFQTLAPDPTSVVGCFYFLLLAPLLFWFFAANHSAPK